MERLLVTGGAGFVGSSVVRLALLEGCKRVVVLDRFTWASGPDNLDGAAADPRLTIVEGDVAHRADVERAFSEARPDAVIHLASEVPLDRRGEDPRTLVRTGMNGTLEVLEAARGYAASLSEPARARFRVVRGSGDEVFGSLGPTGRFDDRTPYAPTSPAAAVAAAGDHLALAYVAAWGLPVIVAIGANAFGPRQFPEKLVPATILRALEGRELDVHGDGLHVRDWMHVDDYAEGLLRAARQGRPGETYLFGGEVEKATLEIVDRICDVLETVAPAAENPALRERGRVSYLALKRHVADRRQNDRRYASDTAKARRELGWAPTRPFEGAIVDVVRWYLDHAPWVEDRRRAARARREALGLGG
jgi:dTDP-glucose 4,6-dehydratase